VVCRGRGVHRPPPAGGHHGGVNGTPSGTLDPAVAVHAPPGRRVLRRRRALYTATTVVLAAVLGLAVLDTTPAADVYGVKTATARADGGGYELAVRHATVSRPGLATPFEVTVERPGGLPDPVRVAVDRDYLAIWDPGALAPEPAGETGDREVVVWELAPPASGDVVTVSLAGRIDPGVQQGERGRVAVVDERGEAVVAVEVATRVMP